MWIQVNVKCFRDLLFLCRLVHFGLKEINEFGLLGDGPLHLYLLVGVYSLQQRKHIFREGNTSEYNLKRTPSENTSSWPPLRYLVLCQHHHSNLTSN